jgi:hypothetical protein
MRARLTKLGLAVAALAALAVGGSTLASAGGTGSQPTEPPATVEPAAAQADTDSIQDENGKDDATEPAEAEKNEASEAAESSSESGSEAPGDDGPGGWADEPGNPNADTQQEGEH